MLKCYIRKTGAKESKIVGLTKEDFLGEWVLELALRNGDYSEGNGRTFGRK